MKWTEMVVAVAMMASVLYFFTLIKGCMHETDVMKFECMKTGKAEAECRFRQ